MNIQNIKSKIMWSLRKAQLIGEKYIGASGY